MRCPQSILVLLCSSIVLINACTKKNSSSENSSGEKKKIFYHLRRSAERSLDPMKQFDEASAQMVQNIYDPLLRYSYLKRPYELEPNLLKEMPVLQSDGLTYIFNLKENVYFHDDEAFPNGKGRKMTSDDVIYSLKRFADSNINTQSYSLIKGFIVGMDSFRSQSNSKDFDYSKNNIEGLKKINESSFSIKFAFKNPLAFHPFAFSGLAIVPREAVEKYGEDFAKHPVGTGPFYLKKYSRRGKHILARNPKYHRTYPKEGMPGDKEKGLLDDAGKQLPLVDEVHLPLIEETQPAMLKFKKGELHWIRMNKDEFNNIATKNEDGSFSLKSDWAKKFSMFYEPMLSSFYMKFNMQDKILGKNKALRQAIALSMNRSGYIDLLHNGRGLVSESIVPFSLNGSANETNSTWYTQNIDLAKKKLVEAGYPEGKGLPPITIEYRATTKDSRQGFEFFRNDWAKIGLKVNANFQTFSTFIKRTESGNYQVADAGWGADFPDGENFYQLLYSKNKAPGPNDGNYSNPEYDKIYEKMRFMEHGPERIALMKKLDAIIKDEVPVLLIYNPLSFGLYQKSVKNFKRNMLVDYPYQYINID